MKVAGIIIFITVNTFALCIFSVSYPNRHYLLLHEPANWNGYIWRMVACLIGLAAMWITLLRHNKSKCSSNCKFLEKEFNNV